MSDWTASETRPGYIEKTITRGAATIVICRPVLSVEEAAAREAKTRTALEGAMREYFNRRKRA